MLRPYLALALALLVWGCGPSADRGPVDVAFIGDDQQLFETGVRLSPGAQHLRGATHEGLVALDQSGQVVPAIAERWIVTDDGLSYIFRLRNSARSGSEPIAAVQVRTMLMQAVLELEGTSLGLDLAKLDEVRAMTGRVIELRLSSPMPEFLRLLAQPELGLGVGDEGLGPMAIERDDDNRRARLSVLSPEERGLPAREDWQELTRELAVQSLPAQAAIDAFTDGEVDLLMNGSIADFPMIELGPLSRGAVQVDPALGLFGLIIRSDAGLLSDPERREALSMAIDRAALIQPFGLGGWRSETWIVPPDLFAPVSLADNRWPDLSIEQRRDIAARRIATWQAVDGQTPTVRVGLPEGPGGAVLFAQLSQAWASIGVRTERVGIGEGAELELRDRLARYSSPRWFLNQLNCSIEIGLCSEEADELVRRSLAIRDPDAKLALLVQAHTLLAEAEVFIPLGVPVRWSLVRGSVDGYQANPWGLHPLPPLALAPN